jgi:hypothetical protein
MQQLIGIRCAKPFMGQFLSQRVTKQKADSQVAHERRGTIAPNIANLPELLCKA